MTEPILGGLSPEQFTSVDLPGHHLALTREERGLSVEDVAQALKFSERQIAALEQDDYSVLHGAAFIRGFIRSYARYLKLDPAPLLAMLDRGVDLSQAEIVAPQNMGDATPARGLSRKVIWGLAGVALVLGGAGYFLAFGVPGEKTSDTKSVAEPHIAVTPPVAVTAAPQHSAPAASDASAPPVTQSPATPAATDLPAPGTTAAIPTPSGALPAPATARPEAAGHQLTIDFDAKSWVEIKRGSEVLLTGEFPAGTQRVVPGPGPFQVWIGNVSGVRLSRDGQAVDLVPSSRGGMARLTLE